VSTQQIIAELKENNDALSHKNDALEHENAILRKALFGPRSEKVKPSSADEDQLNLFADLEVEQAQVETTTIEVKGHKKKKHKGRQPLPDHLPVEEIIIEPDCNTTDMVKIGELVTETLHYTPASLVRRRYIRPKYAAKDGQEIVVADLPERPLPKSIAEASLLSHIIVSKFVDHLPFYRIIKQFQRDYDLIIPSSTLNDWFAASCTLLEPLYNRLKQKVLDTNYLQADESPIKVMDKDKIGKTHQGYQWVYHNPLEKLILFDYRKGRGMHGPKELLANYKGVLQCDGYGVYDKLAKQGEMTLVGCLAHVRRKYVEAKDSDPKLAKHALDIFSQIYMHEKQAKQSEDRKAYRQNHILPLMHSFKQWVEEQYIKVLPKSPIGKAMKYTRNQWSKLINAFTNGDIELDNNLIENKIRALALGRKNYLFAGSHKGAQRIAMMYSFFATCKANEVNPYEWLTQTLEKIPTCNIQDLESLLPNAK